MQMLFRAIQLLFPLVLFFIPCALQWVEKHRNRCLTSFLATAAHRPNVRKFVESVTLVALLLLPLLYSRLIASRLWVLPTLGIILPFFFHGVAERVLFKLNESGHFYVTSLVIFACLYVPHLFPMAITLATIMAAVLFYPPRSLVNDSYSASERELAHSLKKGLPWTQGKD